MECRMCTVEDWRTLIAADRGIDLGAYRKRAGSLHDAKFRLFVAEVTRCEQSFEEFILRNRYKSFPEPAEPVQSKPEDESFVQSRTGQCPIWECEVLVVSLWDLWDAWIAPIRPVRYWLLSRGRWCICHRSFESFPTLPRRPLKKVSLNFVNPAFLTSQQSKVIVPLEPDCDAPQYRYINTRQPRIESDCIPPCCFWAKTGRAAEKKTCAVVRMRMIWSAWSLTISPHHQERYSTSKAFSSEGLLLACCCGCFFSFS